MTDVKAVESKGIKETLELLEGLKVVGVAGVKILKDGKINGSDLPVMIDLIKQHQVLIDAGVGAGEIISEGKDFSTEELVQIGLKAVEIAKAIQAAKV